MGYCLKGERFFSVLATVWKDPKLYCTDVQTAIRNMTTIQDTA